VFDLAFCFSLLFGVSHITDTTCALACYLLVVLSARARRFSPHPGLLSRRRLARPTYSCALAI
jgi:hypothetical protein